MALKNGRLRAAKLIVKCSRELAIVPGRPLVACVPAVFEWEIGSGETSEVRARRLHDPAL